MGSAVALASSELDELADFFARRFDARLAPHDDSGSPLSRAVWRERLVEADATGRLNVLLHQARRRRPNDANLAELVELLAAPNQRADQLVGLLLLGAGVAAMALATVSVGGLIGWAAYQQTGVPSEPVAVAQTVDAPLPVELPPIAPVLHAPAPMPVDVGDTVAPERVVHAAPTGRCTTEAGGIVGYWYAGKRAPNDASVVLDRMVNVRQDYPSRANGWNARSTIACVLRPGDRVQLALPPVHVDGDRYWIPLVSGALDGAEADS